MSLCAGSGMGTYGVHIRLLILTGQRVGQFIRFKPDWMNDKEKLITWPASVMKTNREHVIPYGEMTAGLLPPKPRA